MYLREHAPPHFHAEYSEYEITVDIKTGVVTGRFPRRVLTAVLAWYVLHQEESGKPLLTESRCLKLNLWNSLMFIHVTNAEYCGEYKVWLSFNDGAEGEVDLASELYGQVFEPLKDKEFFKSFKLEGHTLSWDNGADFAPEFLYEQIVPNSTLKQSRALSAR